MAAIRADLLTVAKAAWAISCDDFAYDSETRDTACDLWLLAVELLQNYERRRSYRSLNRRPSAGLRP